MPALLEVKALPDHKLWLKYEDGTVGKVDLSRLVGEGIFAAWNDADFFSSVELRSGAPSWDDEIDLCPDALYLELTGKRPEDVFDGLKRTAS